MAKKEKNNKIITITLAIIICLATITLIYVNLSENVDNTNNGNTSNEIENVLTVVYADIQDFYNFEDIENLDSITGYGGYRTSYPSIKGQGTYTGVPIEFFVESIAGKIENYSLIVHSDDGVLIENKTYNYSIIQGNLNIYNSTNASDSTPVGTGGVKMIICYKANNEYLDESKDGKIKIAFINENNELITASNLWWKYVFSIEIKLDLT